MAGNYPDVPSWRLAYDRDGTIGIYLNGSASAQVKQSSSSHLQQINDEGNIGWDANALDGQWYVLIFPRLMDLDAIHIDGSGLSNFQTSPDTTNVIDGTWDSLSGVSPISHNNKELIREDIDSITALGVRAFRMRGSSESFGEGRWDKLHLYGEPSAGENTDRLRIWDPTTDSRVAPAYFDWGDIPRDSSQDRAFRVKNLSTGQTANDIIVTFETLTDTNPSVDGWHTLSDDGGANFFAQVNIGSLSPGGISSELLLRRATPSDATLGLWWGRIVAVAGSWS